VPFRFRSAAILLASGVIFCFSSCTNSTSKAASESAKAAEAARKPAPDFTLKDENGASVRLSDYKGKVVLLNFWATWCGPCQIEIPWFEQFEQQYKSQGFAVLGVSMDDEGWPAVKPFIAAHKVNYRILLGNDSVGELYGGLDALPTSFLVDREGRLAYTHVGLAGKNEYLNEIQSLLASKQDTAVLRVTGTPALLLGAAE
jgi:peroxiredoxin